MLKFSQRLDHSRPAELIEQRDGRDRLMASRHCGQLHYRYLDTGELVRVPNIRYNQTPAMRLAHWQELRHQAVRDIRQIKQLIEFARPAMDLVPLRVKLEWTERLLGPIDDAIAGNLAGELR